MYIYSHYKTHDSSALPLPCHDAMTFFPSDRFMGARAGYVFKRGELGLGDSGNDWAGFAIVG